MKFYLRVRCARHIHSVDLYDLVSRLQSTVLGDEAVEVDLLDNHAALKEKNINVCL